jgi:hypothetical protein
VEWGTASRPLLQRVCGISRPLTRAFDAAGLDVVTMRYTNPIGLLGWIYNLYLTGNTEHTTGQVRLFERFVAPWALPAGTSRGSADRPVAVRRRPCTAARRMTLPGS